MINAGLEFKSAFDVLLSTFGGTVKIHKDFGCSNSQTFDLVGMKNSKKNNSSIVMFQFPERVDIQKGDIIQQNGSNDFWKVHNTEDNIVGDTFVYFIAYVNRIDSNGNLI